VSDIVCARIQVSGRVQGVWYRASTRDQAHALGLVGTVRNRMDGSVAIVAQGPRGPIEALIGWARRGPPHARVDAVDVEWIEPNPAATTFAITH
jgi:acylphosphatase